MAGGSREGWPRLVMKDLGFLDYQDGLKAMEAHFERRKALKGEDQIFFMEHPEVITLGRKRSSREHVHGAAFSTGIPIVEVNRGGDVTWHGPGQIVAYPVLHLREGERDVHLFLRRIEEGVASFLSELGLLAQAKPAFTGVWVKDKGEALKKICSIGVAMEAWTSQHGLALNVDCDLSRFALIEPCGLSSQVMTSMKAMGLSSLDKELIKKGLYQSLARALCRETVPL